VSTDANERKCYLLDIEKGSMSTEDSIKPPESLNLTGTLQSSVNISQAA
jgi:hypothetical protein